MHVQFISISLTRFRSFDEKATLHFDDAGNGLYFLKGKNKASAALGSNGAGKSSIVDALLWCLYGKTVQGLKNPDIIPWSGKGKTEVEVAVKIDKVVHKIKRTANPNLLTIDEKEAGQNYVDELISIPFEIIPYTIILGQRRPLFFDLTASEKLKLFSEVLNLDRWEQRSTHASELVKSLDFEVNVKEAEIISLENAQRQAESDLKSLKQQSSAWEAERADKLENAENDRKRLEKQIQDVSNQRDTADLKLDRALTELKAFKPLMEKLDQQESSLGVAVNKVRNLEVQAKQNKEQIDGMLASIIEQECPTCKQPLKSKQQRLDLIKGLNDQIAALNITDKEKQSDEAVKKYDKIIAAIEIQEKAKEQFEHDAEDARNVLDRLLPKIAGWEAELKALEKQLQADETNNNPYTDQLQALRRRRDLNKAAIEQAQKIVKTKSEYCERARFWIKGFKDIKLLQVEEILQELEITTNAMTEESGLVNWQLHYDIERETKSGTIARGLNITVLSPVNKNAVKWEVWSGGEAQRLRLIGTAALSSVLLNHVGVTTNLEIYDEPTIGLSTEGVYDLVELLSQRAKATKKSIWLIDHHAVESAHFIQTVLITKDKTGSFLQIV